MRTCWIVAGVLFMTGCNTLHPFQAGAPEGAIDVIAHRGASAYRPENTLAAFQHAVELDADWFELDCTVSRDLAVVVIHDSTLDRTTSGQGAVREFTLPELRSVEAGGWFSEEYRGEPLPTLGESLDLARNTIGVYCEIKNSDNDDALMTEILKRTADAPVRTPETDALMMALIERSLSRNVPLTRNAIREIRDRKMEDSVVIQSFSPIVCAIALIEAPEIRTELLASKDKDRPERWDEYLRWLRLLDVPGFNVSKSVLDEALIAQMHAEGRTVAVWTVDDPEEMRRFADWGVDAIITNKPDVCIDVLDEMGKRWKRPWWD